MICCNSIEQTCSLQVSMEISAEGSDIFSFQLFDPALCRQTISGLASVTQWSAGNIIVPASNSPSGKPEVRRVAECGIGASAELAKVWHQRLATTVAPVAMLCFRYAIADAQMAAKLLRYERGGFYKLHFDLARPLPRLLSLICYLNDDYVGGETSFLRQNVTIKPKPGMAILFPSGVSHIHEAKPVIQGIKYVLSAFFS